MFPRIDSRRPPIEDAAVIASFPHRLALNGTGRQATDDIAADQKEEQQRGKNHENPRRHTSSPLGSRRSPNYSRAPQCRDLVARGLASRRRGGAGERRAWAGFDIFATRTAARKGPRYYRLPFIPSRRIIQLRRSLTAIIPVRPSRTGALYSLRAGRAVNVPVGRLDHRLARLSKRFARARTGRGRRYG